MTQVRQIPFGRPWLTDEDRNAVLEVLNTPVLAHGPHGQSFEQEFAEFAGDGSCIAVSSCMAALHLAWLALGVGPGDEVVVAAQTHVATAHAIEWVGATPVFVDCDPTTGNVRAEDVERSITPRTRGLGLVHFLGIPCDMDAIMAVARRHDLRVVEDCALAVGSRFSGTHVGLFGDAGCFSFYPVKHLATGEGGMLLTRRPEVADRARLMRGFGVDRSHAVRGASGGYDVPVLGLNYRMSELHAALGRSQLRRVAENLQARERNFGLIAPRIEGRDVSVLDWNTSDVLSSRYALGIHLTGKLASQRDQIAGMVRSAGIGTSVYYPHPVPRMAFYQQKYGYQQERFPNATAISDASLCLPVGPHVTEDDAKYIASAVARVLDEERQA